MSDPLLRAVLPRPISSAVPKSCAAAGNASVVATANGMMNFNEASSINVFSMPLIAKPFIYGCQRMPLVQSAGVSYAGLRSSRVPARQRLSEIVRPVSFRGLNAFEPGQCGM